MPIMHAYASTTTKRCGTDVKFRPDQGTWPASDSQQLFCLHPQGRHKAEAMAATEERDGFPCPTTTASPLPPLRAKRRSTIEQLLLPPLQDMQDDQTAEAHQLSQPLVITVGGEGSESSLQLISQLETVTRGDSRNVTPLPPPPSSSSSSSPSSSSVLHWGQEEVYKWLTDVGMVDEIPHFTEHAVTSGRILLQLTEDHLKEMGVRKVGHRITLCTRLNELRREEGITLGVEHLQL